MLRPEGDKRLTPVELFISRGAVYTAGLSPQSPRAGRVPGACPHQLLPVALALALALSSHLSSHHFQLGDLGEDTEYLGPQGFIPRNMEVMLHQKVLVGMK